LDYGKIVGSLTGGTHTVTTDGRPQGGRLLFVKDGGLGGLGGFPRRNHIRACVILEDTYPKLMISVPT
jgi:hypothetical protein